MSDLDVHEVTKGDFSYGEIAPTFQGRVESAEYKQGSALMYNCLPRSGGGWRRRPGTRFVGVIGADSAIARSIPFTAIYGQQFKLTLCLISGVPKIYVYSMATHAFVTTITSGLPAYALADLKAVTWAQSNGQTWLFMSGTATGTPGGVPVCIVTVANPDGTGAWTASQPTFVNNYALYLLIVSNDLLQAAGVAITYGVNPYANGPTLGAAGITASTAANAAATAASTPATATSANLVIAIAALNAIALALSSFASVNYGLYPGPANAAASASTSAYQQAAQLALYTGTFETFASSNHYPGCGEFYGGRIYISGINASPLAQWACTLAPPGITQNYLTFTVDGTAAGGIYLLQNDMNAPAIRWLFASQSLLAGTERSVWMYPDGLSGQPPTASTYWMKKSSAYGALPYSRPMQVVNVALYIGSDAKSFRSLILSMQRGFFADGDLSEQAEHLMSRNAVGFTVTMKPDPTAWIWMQDGSLLSASIKQKDSGFVVEAGSGFAQHSLGGGGLVVDACQLTNTNWDELWLDVNRGGQISVEYLYLDDINTTTQTNSFYVDCGMQQVTGGQTTFTGLPSPLGGQTVAAFGDGKVMPQVVCDKADLVTYTETVNTLNVGFPYYSAWWDLIPMLPAKGGALGMLRSIEKAWLKVMNSLGGWVGQIPPSDPLNNPGETLTNFWDKLQKLGVMTYGAPPAMKSGFLPVDNLPMQIDDNQGVYIAIVDPVPFNLVAITARYKLVEV